MPPVEQLRASAKLTRSLRVTGVRPDGYHLLAAEMVSLDLADEIEIEDGADGLEVVDAVTWVDGTRPPSRAGSPGPSASDLAVAVVPSGGDNLVVRALDAVGRRARVRLTKRIPAGAGLGGGSSDAAAVLRWAAALDPELALKLGADVPFCVAGGRALVSGVGDELEGQPYERFTVVLVTPALAVSTPEVYRAWDSLGGPVGETGNDLELAAVVVEPRLAWWRDLIEDVAGERPRLAGSGSTWFVERSPEAAELLVADLKDAVLSERRRALLVAATSTPGP